jgi:hypothetical protein
MKQIKEETIDPAAEAFNEADSIIEGMDRMFEILQFEPELFENLEK